MAMNNKRYAKIYVLSMLGLYFIGALIIFLLTFFISKRNDVNNALEINQIIVISLLLPLVPCASYAGFCTAFGRIKEFGKFWKIAICIFFPITLFAITLYGLFMIIPSMIKQSLIIMNDE
ncbi:MAG: hypothetical protein IJ731_05670 [Eubacterium sp.]|nr:hypothetical protein [Eubacterium sp.]